MTLWLSKTKVGTYQACPLQYKLNYVDKVPQAPNKYFEIGIDVHDFHNKLFDSAKVVCGNLQFSEFDLGSNRDYKSRIVEHYLDRWQLCVKHKPDKPSYYFFPITREQKIELSDIGLNGIPDAVMRDFNDRPYVLELKTGSPTKDKIKKYKNDLIWYKLLFERQSPEYGEVSTGRVYFPRTNQEWEYDLCAAEVERLIADIKEVRAKIELNKFEPTPEASKCNWCGYKSVCEYKR